MIHINKWAMIVLLPLIACMAGCESDLKEQPPPISLSQDSAEDTSESLSQPSSIREFPAADGNSEATSSESVDSLNPSTSSAAAEQSNTDVLPDSTNILLEMESDSVRLEYILGIEPLNAQITNRSNYEVVPSLAFTIEYHNGSNWEAVPFRDPQANGNYPEILPGKSLQISFEHGGLSGGIGVGKYRYVLNILIPKTGDSFTITDEIYAHDRLDPNAPPGTLDNPIGMPEGVGE